MDREEVVDGRPRRYYRITDDGALAVTREAERMQRAARIVIERATGRSCRGGVRMTATPYSWSLAAYPRAHRDGHGAEMLATLAAAYPPGRRIPPLREVGALSRAGTAARVRAVTERPAPWWADGIHLGIFVIALLMCAPEAANVLDAVVGLSEHVGFNHSPWWYPSDELPPMLVTSALTRGDVRTAVPFAGLMPAHLLHTQWTTFGRSPLTDRPPWATVQIHPEAPVHVALTGLVTLAALLAATGLVTRTARRARL